MDIHPERGNKVQMPGRENSEMTREDRLLETFVTLADTLIDQYDIIDFLQTLAESCVNLVDVSAAGIMLADQHGELRHAACSNEKMRFVELMELQLEEGPCFDAFRTGLPVVAASADEAAERWPNFAPQAKAGGFTGFSAVPMRLRTEVIGALNLFSFDDLSLNDADVKVVQAMADVATIGILHERLIRDANAFSTQLKVALESRIVIEQAKGIIAEHSKVSVDVAFDQIRAFSRGNNRLLSDTARQVIDGSLRTDELGTTMSLVADPAHE
jgi:transcriptional regulator with GAF, ATPase, and Fis domain